jgi:hypothetical protein
MALIQTTGLISSIKGSVGGTTFSVNPAGLTAKKRLVGKRIPNQSQSSALNNSMSTTVAWNGLTYSQKNVFNLYALANTYTDRYGVTKPLTGYQWFKQLSQASQYFTGAQLLSPPLYSIPAALPTFTLYCEHDGLRVRWSTPIDTSQLYIYLYATAPTRSQARLQRGAYKMLDVRSLDYSSFFDITDAWNKAFNMDFSTFTTGATFNINVFIFAVQRTSFNSGIAQSAGAPLI